MCFANCVMKATSAKARTERRDKETWMDHRVVVFARVKMKQVGLMFRKTMRNLSTMHTSSPEQGATLHGLRFFYPLVCFYGFFSRFPCEGPALFGAFAGERWPWHSRPQRQTLSEHDPAGSGNVPQSHNRLYAKNPKVFFPKIPIRIGKMPCASMNCWGEIW